MNPPTEFALRAPEQAPYSHISDFFSLLDKEFRPRTDEAREAMEGAVRTLAEQALLHAVSLRDDACGSIDAIIAKIDRKLSAQINLVVHKPEFQQLESAWRGLHHLVFHTETDEQLKIRFMDISKDEVRRHRGAASWQELTNARDLAKITSNLEHAPGNSLRATEDARYVGLAMPRFLVRLPYGARTNPVDEVDFEEGADDADHRDDVRRNAACAMAADINGGFTRHRSCTMVRNVGSDGSVENPSCHTVPTDDGGVDMQCSTEIAIGDRREAELARTGPIAFVHRKNTDHTAFIGAQSSHPQACIDPDGTAKANLSTQLNDSP